MAGVGGGVGTTTVARALAATDCGIYRDGAVDVVVCRDTVVSIGAAHRVVAHAPGRPVLAVVASTPARMPKPAVARLDMVRPHVAAAVLVPFVLHWRALVHPWSQAADLLRHSDEQTPKSLRPIRGAFQRIHTAVLEVGRPSAPPDPPGAPRHSQPSRLPLELGPGQATERI